jgi:hypothetical protein
MTYTAPSVYISKIIINGREYCRLLRIIITDHSHINNIDKLKFINRSISNNKYRSKDLSKRDIDKYIRDILE